jgi:homogentisate phytyltransferase/homogentisate geranylgeranyltransferase
VQGPGDFGSQAAIGLLQALIPALLMNICIVGMNQIFDVDIDKVNKPYLPLASGDWSLNTGISVAVGTGLVAVLLGLYIGSPPLLATLVGSLLLGSDGRSTPSWQWGASFVSGKLHCM